MKNNDANAAREMNFEEDPNESSPNRPASELKLVVSKKKLPNNCGNAKKHQRKSCTNVDHRVS